MERSNAAELQGEELYQKGAMPQSERDELRTRTHILGVILGTSIDTTPELRK